MFNAKLALGSVLAMSLTAWGCGKPAAEPAKNVTATSHSHDGHDHAGHDHAHEGHDHAGHDHAHADAGHDHSGWWCPEHAVPEEVCGLCDPKVAAKMKAEGDWCKTHDRPDTQCFVCHPELEAKFAALYEAKYGEQPPKR
jgi:hypothetical protein